MIGKWTDGCLSFWSSTIGNEKLLSKQRDLSETIIVSGYWYICIQTHEVELMIYLDNNATTQVDAEVLKEMLPYFSQHFGNASSKSHAPGWIAEEAVKIAREKVGTLLNVHPRDIVFTSGATESVNLAIKGVFDRYQTKGNHIITYQTEHKAVLDTCAALEGRGASVTYLPVDRDGLPDLKILEDAIRPDTILVSAMWANNETGVVMPVQEIGQICAKKDVLFFSDGTQAVGKIPVDPLACGIHLLAFSAHKMYGPKGVGGLYVCSKQPRVRLTPLLDGGGHERGFRSGTLNVPGIVGLGKACEIAGQRLDADFIKWEKWRNALERSLIDQMEYCFVNGANAPRLPNVSNISFKHVEGERLMLSFNQKMAVSSGSACTSASLDPSHVLNAMGLSDDEAHGSIRFSFGRFNREEEIDEAIQLTLTGVNKLRSGSQIWKLFLESRK